MVRKGIRYVDLHFTLGMIRVMVFVVVEDKWKV